MAELLIRQETEALAWPKELDAGDASTEADIDTLEVLLTALSRRTGDADACRLYAQELLDRAARRDAARAAETCRSLGDPERVRLPDRTAGVGQRAVHGRVLAAPDAFPRGSGDHRAREGRVGAVLQAVLPKETVLVVNKELAALVLGAEEAERIPPCNAKRRSGVPGPLSRASWGTWRRAASCCAR